MVYMSSLALSVLLSLVSAVAYAAGAIVQERVAAAGDGRSLAPLRNRVWWAAVALNGAGAVLHVVALAYGPLSLVQPLGALTIVFALPMAALFVRRRARATAWRGAIMATVGLAGLLALTGNGESRSLSGPDQLMLSGVTLGGVAALFLASKGVHRPVVRSVIVAGAAGVAFGIASVFTKTVAVRWTSGDAGAGMPALLAIAAFAAAGLLLSQIAYRGAGLTAPLATVTVVNPVIAAAVGITMFDEEFRHGTAGTVLALACGVVAAGGLILLTTERLGAEHLAGRSAGSEHPVVAGDGTVGADAAGRDGKQGADGVAEPAAGLSRPVGTRTVVAPCEPATAVPAAMTPVRPAAADEAVAEAFSVAPALPPLRPLKRRLGQVEFGPGRPSDTRPAARRDDMPSTGSGAADEAAGPPKAVQTLTPPALR
ncbi:MULTISPECIES: DMT family transporter [unclassified Streptomyces]|uniref:DMT family transporter n=1 Tax=unclassified Streptomyces TaxID=2593676 RepID=UPI00224FC577|nr:MULTISPECIES: DMT family transporter [unclassified Streptomyces]WSP59272.1 DMT family transporter [Streptomyces sp. NBC_01241]WSU20207.1 DMT family transporter [Streptomyces sp. NBC_01108]MCX4791023.1 DMT family transporter [Streptomyces sp. NBC_01221]MCX4793252.1 DMT family transporter [Streptomyces sp. NBC_01242]WSJ34693.1 DMT family transporter [Streptomyces sp. NBC_01321]